MLRLSLKIRPVIVGVIFSCLITSNTFAIETTGFRQFEEIVVLGLSEYERKGAKAAINIWVDDGPLEGSEEASKHVEVLKTFESEYGKFRSGEMVHEHQIVSSTRIVYMVFNYEQRPLYSRFIVFRGEHR